MSIITEVVDLDEQLAKDLLAQNTGNRPFKYEAIARYAKDLVAGRWHMNGEAIKISADGRLLDGQNRCAAVITANAHRDPDVPPITMPVLMVRGLEDGAQDVMDTGVKRSVSDQLHRTGVKYTAVVSAAAKLVLLYESSSLFGKDLTTSSEIQEFIAANPQLEEYATVVYQMSYKGDLLLTPSALVACMLLILGTTRDTDAAMLFFERLIQGTGLDQGSPLLALRQRMTQAKVNKERLINKAQVNLIIRVWNAHRTGTPMSKVPVSVRGKVYQVKKIEA